MAFLDSVVIPKGPAGSGVTTPSAGGFFGSVSVPSNPEAEAAAVRSQELASQAQVQKANADYEPNFLGQAQNFGASLLDQTAGAVKRQFQAGVQQAKEPFEEKKAAGGGGVGPLKAAEGAFKVGAGVATSIFAPAAPLFEKIGQLVNKAGESLADTAPFQAYGKANVGTPAGEQTTPERILTDIINAATVAQAVLGGVIAFKPKVKGGFLENAKAAPPAMEAPRAPVVPSLPKTGAELHAEYAKRMGYEPYLPTEQLPVIEAGGKGKGSLPIVQIETKTGKTRKGELSVEPLKETPTPSQGPAVPFSAEIGVGETAPLKPVESLGPTLKSQMAVGVEARAISNKLATAFADLPEYNKVNWDEQGQYAAHLLANEPEKALRIAMGVESPPPHILPEAVFKAVEDWAMKTGDVSTLHRLASQSNLSLQATAMGQRIGYLSQFDGESAVGALQKITKARAPRAQKEAGMFKKTAETEIKKTRSSRQSVEEFIKELRCNY